MISLGPFILIGGISIVILLCWAWLPFAVIAKLCRLGSHRKQDQGLLPVRAAAGEVRYDAEGFVPPPPALHRDPRALNPEVRHHNYPKVDPRKGEHHFQDREATLGLDRKTGGGRYPRSREERTKPAGLAGQEVESDVQEPAAALDRDRGRERWENIHLDEEQ